MADYSVVFARSARKELQALEPRAAQRIFSRIEGFALDPRPTGCRKLEGADDLWRIRVGDYRVVCRILDGQRVVDVVMVRHRRDVYR